MRSAAAAFAFDFSRRLRWGLIALGAYLAVITFVQLAVVGPRPITFQHGLIFAFSISIPLTGTAFFFVAVFSYGLGGDLAARQSMYPPRLFTLPVSTAALAGIPMLYGTLAIAGLTLVAIPLAVWPAGLDIPLAWPPLFAAAILAWMQVFTWMPYGLRGMRVVLAVVLLVGIDVGVFLAVELRAPQAVMVALLAPQLPLAYLAARYAVARARRGEVPDWGGLFERLGRLVPAPGRVVGRFPSASRAQAWFEWQEHGRSLPGWMLVILPFEILFLYVVRNEPPALTFLYLAVILLTPPFVAAFVALTVGRTTHGGAATFGLTPFTATRPLGTVALAAAKLRVALSSTLAAWLIVLLAIPAGLTLAGTWPVVVDKVQRAIPFVGAPRVAAALALGTALLFASTWKQIVQGLVIGLTGREGLIKSSVVVRLFLLAVLGVAFTETPKGFVFRTVVTNGKWIVAGLAVLKLALAAWTAARLARLRLLPDRALVTAAAAWLAAVLALDALLAWMFDTAHMPRYFLLLVAVLAVPLVRPSLVPLALASNRHQGTTGPVPARAGRAVAAVLAILAAPLGLALAEAVWFYRHHANDGAIVSSGRRREYVLHVPKSYDPARPTPLVISMHGAGLWPVIHMEMSRWNEVANEHGFLVVYPAGLGAVPVWRLGEHPGPTTRDRDVRFIADLIDALKARYNIDPARIYADGLSNGGGMAFALSCTLSDRIAAVGLVASAQLIPWHWCRDPSPVPMIAFHGTEDRFTPYHGGSSPVAPVRPFPDIPTWALRWSRRNGCAPEGVDSRVAPDVTRLEYTGCVNDASVVLYTIHGGGHTWPGGGPMPEWFLGPTTRSLDASRVSWAFFQAHPLVGRR